MRRRSSFAETPSMARTGSAIERSPAPRAACRGRSPRWRPGKAVAGVREGLLEGAKGGRQRDGVDHGLVKLFCDVLDGVHLQLRNIPPARVHQRRTRGVKRLDAG